MQIFMTGSDNHYNYSNNQYYFVNECGYLKFYQLGSFDLAFTVHKFDDEKSVISFNIDKNEYSKVYELITDMLDAIEKLKYLRETNIISPEYKELYEKGYFSWKSDAPVNENCNYKEDFIYNYFSIHKGNNSYMFEFICNTDKPYFTVEVNTDRSRYAGLRFPVWAFFNNLEGACEKVESNDEIREILKFYHNQKVKKITNKSF